LSKRFKLSPMQERAVRLSARYVRVVAGETEVITKRIACVPLVKKAGADVAVDFGEIIAASQEQTADLPVARYQTP